MRKTIVILIIIACIALSYFFPHAMINPGELTAEHQMLNNKCQSCHTLLKGISNEKCISCHAIEKIGMDSLINSDTIPSNQKTRFHMHLLQQTCTSCHTDHQGKHPVIDKNRFNHEMLEQTVISNCVSCHNKPIDNLHQLVTNKCNSCHNTNGWKSGATFNHDLLVEVNKNNCNNCHLKPADSYHQLITSNCNQCHSTKQWVPSTFDHSSYFVLDRNHQATCNTCHTGKDFKVVTCYGCHEHSESKIIAEHNEEGIYQISRCASCHKSGNEHDIISNGKQSMDAEESKRVKNFQKANDRRKEDVDD